MSLFCQARSRLSQFLLRFQPTVVASVFPAYPGSCWSDPGRRRPATFRRVVCITDSITVNAIWFRCASDLFLVPNEQTAAVLARAGCLTTKVRVTVFQSRRGSRSWANQRQAPVPGGERRLFT